MKKYINIREVINFLLAFLISLFPVVNAMEREESAAQVRAEVERVLGNFQRNMNAYYERTGNQKRISIIPTEEPEKPKSRIKTKENLQRQTERERGERWRERRGGGGHKRWREMSEEERQRLREQRREAWEGMTEEERQQQRLWREQRCQARGGKKGDCGRSCRKGGGEGLRCRRGK